MNSSAINENVTSTFFFFFFIFSKALTVIWESVGRYYSISFWVLINQGGQKKQKNEKGHAEIQEGGQVVNR